MNYKTRNFFVFILSISILIGAQVYATTVGPTGISDTLWTNSTYGNFETVIINETSFDPSVFNYPQQSDSYIVWQTGSVYYAKNSNTGAVTSTASAHTLFQTLHDALPTSGGAIYVKNGNYTFTSNVTITTESVSIIGESFGTWYGDGVYIANSVTDVFIIDDADGFVLKNLFIAGAGGTGNTQVAINITNTDYWTVENIRLRYFGAPIILNSARWGKMENVIASSTAINGTSIKFISSGLNQLENIIVGGSQIGACQINITGGEANRLIGIHLNGANNASKPDVGIDVYSDYTFIDGLVSSDWSTQAAVRFNSGSDKNVLTGYSGLPITNEGSSNLIEEYQDNYITVPFSVYLGGATMTIDGLEVDANGEYVVAYLTLPDDVLEVVEVEAIAISNVANTTGMRAKMRVYGGGDSEPETSISIQDNDRSSVTASIAVDDYIHWNINSVTLANINGGDSMKIQMLHAAANGGDCETDCDFTSVKIKVKYH